MASLPLLISALRSPADGRHTNNIRYRYGMLILTFFCYLTYHMSRKPLSIVKGQLHRNCSNLTKNLNNLGYPYTIELESSVNDAAQLVSGNFSNDTWCDFAPFNQPNYKSLFGELDYAFLFTYAIGMYISGFIAERMSIRYFLTIGMISSGIFTAMFGIGYFANIHSLTFYIVAQILNGAAQTTGWPAVVTVVGNWFGKERRGLIMGIWNSHTSFGNILGSVIASVFVGYSWGLSFIVPGAIITGVGIICFFTLIDKPEDLGASYQPIQPECNDNSTNSKVYSDVLDQEANSSENLLSESAAGEDEVAIGFIGALCIPGVVEFALCLLFAKLVSYTFLFWLPFYIQNTSDHDTTVSGLLSTLFDVGGIFGGILAGYVSDKTRAQACTCSVMLIIGACMMYLFNAFDDVSNTVTVILLLVTGAFVNGPYALITTAVSADLGTHPSLKGNAKALSTVTAIIDGTGSIGAAFGPLLTGWISPTGWMNVFWMLIAANVLAVIFLLRLVVKEVMGCCSRRRTSEYLRYVDSGQSLNGGTDA